MQSIHKKITHLFFCLCLLTFTLTGCSGLKSLSEESTCIEDVGYYFDTVVKLTIYGTSDTSIIEDCFAEMARYDDMLSRTKEGSDIWNINHSNGAPVEVSAETIDLLQLAISFAQLSDGAFDPTIGSVTALWDFTENTEGILPAPELIASALTHVDYTAINIEGTEITLADPEAAIDLGGIAKGYIADQLKSFLINKGVKSALINLGGNNLAIGTKPENQPWKIGVKKPFGGESDLVSILPVDDQSVVTSGIYERYFEKDGRIYHHLLDTSTGYPTDNSLQGVTILSDSSGAGDALSTICFTMGLEKGMNLIESLENTEALFITEDGTLHRSSGFPE